MADEFETDFVRALRDHALTYTGVNEGTSCVNRAFKAGTKGFLYLGEKPETYRVMVKLEQSLDEARALAEQEPDLYAVGKTNWVTAVLPRDEQPTGLLKRWIDESFRLQASKKLLAELD